VARGGEVEALRRGAAGQRQPQEIRSCREGDGDGEQRVVGGGVEHGGQTSSVIVTSIDRETQTNKISSWRRIAREKPMANVAACRAT
jgi:hypothetical protein